MANPEIRPATREDVREAFLNLYGEARDPPVRIIAYTGRVDGRVIAVGGIGIYENGARTAFCDVSDEGRKYPLSLHRAAILVLKKAQRLGIRTIFVVDEERVHQKTPNWLRHLGFEERRGADGLFYVWRAG
jgi:hypothetical protein